MRCARWAGDDRCSRAYCRTMRRIAPCGGHAFYTGMVDPSQRSLRGLCDRFHARPGNTGLVASSRAEPRNRPHSHVSTRERTVYVVGATVVRGLVHVDFKPWIRDGTRCQGSIRGKQMPRNNGGDASRGCPADGAPQVQPRDTSRIATSSGMTMFPPINGSWCAS